jgi:hypothetical protein
MKIVNNNNNNNNMWKKKIIIIIMKIICNENISIIMAMKIM